MTAPRLVEDIVTLEVRASERQLQADTLPLDTCRVILFLCRLLSALMNAV